MNESLATEVRPRSAAAPARRRRTCGEALAAVAKRQLTVFSGALAGLAVREDQEAVHDLRVATRRLQAILSVLEPSSEDGELRKLRRSLRRLRATLGEWRNCDVTLGDLADRRRRARAPYEQSAWLRVARDLRRRRGAEVRRGRARLRRDIERDLAARVSRAIDERLQATAPRELRRALEARIDTTWRQWSECCARAEKAPSAETIHALRVATKRLRYPVELVHEISRRRSTPILAWCRRVQKTLGDWHDRDVLHHSIAEAIVRPELALEDPDGTLAVLSTIARERREGPAMGREIIALAHPEQGLSAMRRWWRATSRTRNRGAA